jgi:hypothetical protein
MNHRILSALGILSTAALAWASPAQATTVKVNSTTVFATNYEGDTATSLTFGDAGNTNANDFDPSTTQMGSWWTTSTPAGTGMYEGTGNSGTFNYNVSSKQVQVTNSTATGGSGLNFDPGPNQGSKYLRGYRTNVSGNYNGKWEAFPNALTTSGTDTITFETAVYVTPFTANGTAYADLVTGYSNLSAFAQRFRLTVDASGNLRNGSAGPDTGVDFPLGQWNTLLVSYTEGSSTWSVAVNGGTPVTTLAVTSSGSLGGLSFGGGQQAPARTNNTTGAPLVYFDAVPEPGSVLLAGLGFIGMAGLCLRKRR